MSERDRFYISKKSRSFVNDLSNMNRNPLGMKPISRLDLFKIAVALGLDKGIEFEGGKEGLFLSKDLKSTKDKALFNVVLLGNANTNDEIDDYCDLELNYKECERCANYGFSILKQYIDENSSDELLRKKVLNSLDILYNTNVKLNKNSSSK